MLLFHLGHGASVGLSLVLAVHVLHDSKQSGCFSDSTEVDAERLQLYVEILQQSHSSSTSAALLCLLSLPER